METIKQRLKEIKELKEKTLTEYCDLVLKKLNEILDYDILIAKLKDYDEGTRWINIWDDCYDFFGYTPYHIEDILDDFQNNIDISTILKDSDIIAIDVDEEKRILTYEIIKL